MYIKVLVAVPECGAETIYDRSISMDPNLYLPGIKSNAKQIRIWLYPEVFAHARNFWKLEQHKMHCMDVMVSDYRNTFQICR